MQNLSSQKGFSIVELLVAMAILVVLTSIAIFSLSAPRKFSVDDQSKRLVDMLDEARQKSLNQKTTFRVEINKTKNQITLIDENASGSADDDKIVRSQPLTSQVIVGIKPGNVTTGPTTTSPIAVPQYAGSNYPLSNGDEKITFRFKTNGEVVDAGTDNIGTGSQPNGATIYVHSTTPSVANPELIRAVTVLGTSGDTSIYKCKFVSGVCGNWTR